MESPSQLIDLARYPILDLRSAPARELIERTRAELAATGCCELPGFLTTGAVDAIIAETGPLLARGHHAEGPVQPYLEPADPSLPASHPRRHLGRSSLAAIAYDLFPLDHPLRQLYEFDPLMEFIGATLGLEQLYRYADPLGALNIAVMGDEDELGWHFDQTDFVTSIALRDADHGGDFEYAPGIRSDDDENFEGVRSVLEGSRERVRRVPMVSGTLLLFKGRHALHRVTSIRGSTSRLVALLAYDAKPGTQSSELLRLARYGRSG